MKTVSLTELRKNLPAIVESFAAQRESYYKVMHSGKPVFGLASIELFEIIQQAAECDRGGALLPREMLLAILTRMTALISEGEQCLSVGQLLAEITRQAKISADYVQLQKIYAKSASANNAAK